MTCPHCGAEHDETKGRFCDACGMSVIQYAKKAGESKERTGEEDDEDEEKKVHCRFCGVASTFPKCPACGTMMPVPED
jgi:hypothetical protein